MNDYYNDPPEDPEVPECCDIPMDCDEAGNLSCAICSNRIWNYPYWNETHHGLKALDYSEVQYCASCDIFVQRIESMESLISHQANLIDNLKHLLTQALKQISKVE